MQVVAIKDSEKLAALGQICMFSPDGTEAVCFDKQEIEDLASELSSGKISLAYLAEHVNLSTYQMHFVVEQLLKAGQVNGDLTYTAFTSAGAGRLLALKKLTAQKREHRRIMTAKRK